MQQPERSVPAAIVEGLHFIDEDDPSLIGAESSRWCATL
jgi:hypothetical protein